MPAPVLGLHNVASIETEVPDMTLCFSDATNVIAHKMCKKLTHKMCKKLTIEGKNMMCPTGYVIFSSNDT